MFCVRQISAMPVLQALLTVHCAKVQIAMLLIHVSVSILLSMTLSTSAMCLATVVSLAQTHYALTALSILQVIVLRV